MSGEKREADAGATGREPEWLEALRRGSGLSLDSEGEWHFGAGRVENDRVQALFHAGVEVREDGEVILRVGGMWCYVKCSSGAARFVSHIDWEVGSARLLDGRDLPLGQAQAGWAPDSRLYLWFDGVKGPAICLRKAHQSIVARFDESDAPVIALGHGQCLRIAILDTLPLPDSPSPRATGP